MRLKIIVEHPDAGYVWDVFNRFINCLPREKRVKLQVELEEVEE